MIKSITPNHPVIIVGAGLSGLYAAACLKAKGIAPLLLEGRTRIGGRILSFEAGGQAFELGPSWVWPGQPHIAGLAKELGLSCFPQYSNGALLYQQADGRLDRHDGLAPMANALRIAGGPSALVTALAEQVGEGTIRLGHKVTRLDAVDGHIHVTTKTTAGEHTFEAAHVGLAIPPRFCAGLEFVPALARTFAERLRALPTWMAGHAKFTAVYETPFWREAGLSGDAMSRRGPLAEIHDISPMEGGPYALFGFVGLDAQARKHLPTGALEAACKAQLSDIFGPMASEPVATRLQDWSGEPFTAAPEDQAPLRHHPAYGLAERSDAPWTDRLHFLSTETARENGGLIEGALQSGYDFARALEGSAEDTPDGHPRTAKMSWDWL